MSVAEKLSVLRSGQMGRQAEKTESQRSAIREAMPPAMVAFADAMRDGLDAKLTYLKTPTIEISQPGEHGCSDFILLGISAAGNEKQTQPSAGKVPSRAGFDATKRSIK